MKFVFPIITVIAIILAGYFYSQIRVLKQNPQASANDGKRLLDEYRDNYYTALEDYSQLALIHAPRYRGACQRS